MRVELAVRNISCITWAQFQLGSVIYTVDQRAHDWIAVLVSAILAASATPNAATVKNPPISIAGTAGTPGLP